MAERLCTAGIQAPESVAGCLGELPAPDDIDALAPLLAGPDCLEGIRAVASWVEADNSGRIIVDATDRAAMIAEFH